MIPLLGFDGVVLAAFALTYLLVTRRRSRIYLLVDHLAVMARKSMPLHAGLRLMAQDLGGILGLELGRLARRVEEGSSLEEALDQVPRVVPPLLKRLIVLGEQHGSLAGFLQEARRSYRRVAEAPSQSVYYLLYPVFLSLFVNVSLTSLCETILPKFQEVFRQLHAPMTRLAWIPWILLGNQVVLLISVLLIAFVFSGAGSLHFGAGWWKAWAPLDRGVLALPFFGGIVREASLQAFAASTGVLLQAGASLPEAVGAAAEAERNSLLRRRYRRVAGALRDGLGFSRALREEGFPTDFIWFVEAGEASGALAGHLQDGATHYSTRSRFKAGIAWRAMVPLFAVLNGGLVGATCVLILGSLRDIMKEIPLW